MHLRRGIAPVLYHLYEDDLEVGRLYRTDSATIVVSFTGFASATVAASAAWLAYCGRAAYEDQFAQLALDGQERFPARHRERVGANEVHELETRPDGGVTVLLLGGDEIARISPDSDGDGNSVAESWSIELGLGPSDTPVVFALAAARRMWEAIRRAGLWRDMVQGLTAAGR